MTRKLPFESTHDWTYTLHQSIGTITQDLFPSETDREVTCIKQITVTWTQADQEVTVIIDFTREFNRFMLTDGNNGSWTKKNIFTFDPIKCAENDIAKNAQQRMLALQQAFASGDERILGFRHAASLLENTLQQTIFLEPPYPKENEGFQVGKRVSLCVGSESYYLDWPEEGVPFDKDVTLKTYPDCETDEPTGQLVLYKRPVDGYSPHYWNAIQHRARVLSLLPAYDDPAKNRSAVFTSARLLSQFGRPMPGPNSEILLTGLTDGVTIEREISLCRKTGLTCFSSLTITKRLEALLALASTIAYMNKKGYVNFGLGCHSVTFDSKHSRLHIADVDRYCHRGEAVLSFGTAEQLTIDPHLQNRIPQSSECVKNYLNKSVCLFEPKQSILINQVISEFFDLLAEVYQFAFIVAGLFDGIYFGTEIPPAESGYFGIMITPLESSYDQIKHKYVAASADQFMKLKSALTNLVTDMQKAEGRLTIEGVIQQLEHLIALSQEEVQQHEQSAAASAADASAIASSAVGELTDMFLHRSLGSSTVDAKEPPPTVAPSSMGPK